MYRCRRGIGGSIEKRKLYLEPEKSSTQQIYGRFRYVKIGVQFCRNKIVVGSDGGQILRTTTN